MLAGRGHQALPDRDLPGKPGGVRKTLLIESPQQASKGSPEAGYVEQRSADLTFYLLEAPAPRGAVRILREQGLHLPGATITLAIIGSSHLVEVATAGGSLCELLACPHPGLEAAPIRVRRQGAHPWRYETHRGGLSYRCELWRSVHPPAEFQAESQRLLVDSPRRLRYSFPRGGGAPGNGVTCLEWWAEGRRATIATHHTFPEESIIVRTRSVIDLEEAGEML